MSPTEPRPTPPTTTASAHGGWARIAVAGAVGVALCLTLTRSGSGGDPPPDDGTLRDECSAGYDDACNLLAVQAPPGSDDEDHGRTCAGRRTSASTTCTTRTPTDHRHDAGYARPSEHGDDPDLDALWDACAAGDATSCDDLYLTAPFGSRYAQFGDTCADRRAPGTHCSCVGHTP